MRLDKTKNNKIKGTKRSSTPAAAADAVRTKRRRANEDKEVNAIKRKTTKKPSSSEFPPKEAEDMVTAVPTSEDDDDSSVDDQEDELMYTKTQQECTPSDNEEDDEEADQDDNFDGLEAEFELFDPCEDHYHGIRHFLVENVLPHVVTKAVRPRKARHQPRDKQQTEGNDEEENDDAPKETTVQEAAAEEGAGVEKQQAEQPTNTTTQPLSSRLADCICNQGNIGTVLCLPDEEKKSAEGCVVGLATIMNFKQYASCGFDEVRTALLSAARRRINNTQQLRQFEHLLEKGTTDKNKIVGLLLNERLVNIPQQIAPEILSNLRKDVKWSQRTPECPEDERPFYFFTHLIGISRCFVLPSDFSKDNNETAAASDNSKKKNKATSRQKAVDVSRQQQRLGFPKVEDEFFVKYSDIHFTIPTNLMSRVPSGESGDGKLIDVPEHKLVFAIPYEKLRDVIRECKAAIDGAAA